MNMQARESIRFLDQHLAREKPKDTTTSYLRTQKVNEQLTEWSQAEAYWIGEESRANIVEALISDDEEENGDKVIHESDVESLSSSDDLFQLNRRQFDEDSSEAESSDEEDDEEELDQFVETQWKTWIDEKTEQAATVEKLNDNLVSVTVSRSKMEISLPSPPCESHFFTRYIDMALVD